MKPGFVAVRAGSGWDPDPVSDITALLRPIMVIRGGVVVGTAAPVTPPARHADGGAGAP